jgi:glyoxylase-like metal-dependent hydrolase (beta-lactamase superfamily II)
MLRLSEHLWRIKDSCNVYVVAGGDKAICVDFGTGAALRQPPLQGLRGPSDVVMTHHHRDQDQGLPLAVAAGARVWAPHADQDLFRRSTRTSRRARSSTTTTCARIALRCPIRCRCRVIVVQD